MTPNKISITAIMFCLLTIEKRNNTKLIKLPIQLPGVSLNWKKLLDLIKFSV
jgi:hypothetical protein